MAGGRDRFDLVVADVLMPGLTGPALVRQLLEERPDLKVLFITGYVAEIAGPLPAGATLLQKPFDVAELAGTVRRVLDG